MMTDSSKSNIVLFDTLTAKKQELKTLEPGKCGVYCCGPTVYGLSHVGNARAALVPDVMVRFLRQQGYEVKYVRNITDIDDKIINRSQEEGISAAEVAEKYTSEYDHDMKSLNILEPTVQPKVSDHVPEIIALVQSLVDNGLAYDVDGDVYYRVTEFQGYGKLSKRNVDEMLESAGSRIDVDERKESPLDFALWKSAKPGEPSWSSPWGEGRPGWHIECSAMSSSHLGDSFDIHGGGRDLIFPHHENEIAQSQGAHGEDTYATYWVHNGFIDFAGEKMSKSLGNFFTTREITALYDPEILRYFLLTVHYRSGLNFEVEVKCPSCEKSMDKNQQDSGNCAECGAHTPVDELRKRVRFPGLEEADDRLAYIYSSLQKAKAFLDTAKKPGEDGFISPIIANMLPAFIAHMCNDFNTGGALGELSKPLHEINSLLASGKGIDKASRYSSIACFVADMVPVAEIIGCFGQDPATWLLARRDGRARRMGLDTDRVDALVLARQKAREEKDWAEADRTRDELAALGVRVMDGPDGSVWDFI